jgi:hypothetical protein
MKEMVAQSGESIQKDVLKGLGPVSHQIQPHNPEISLNWASKIQTWYNNQKTVSAEGRSTLVHVGTLWNYWLVIELLHKDNILAHMGKTDLIHIDPDWISRLDQRVPVFCQQGH